MKVTVGAIRQIVREEAERLNEDAGADAEAAAISDMDMLKWTKTEMMDRLKELPNRWNDELKAGITDFIKLLGQNPATANLIMKKAAAKTEESYNRTELRDLIMAEANDLLGE
mgnify:CR=1 FL=1